MRKRLVSSKWHQKSNFPPEIANGTQRDTELTVANLYPRFPLLYLSAKPGEDTTEPGGLPQSGPVYLATSLLSIATVGLHSMMNKDSWPQFSTIDSPYCKRLLPFSCWCSSIK